MASPPPVTESPRGADERYRGGPENPLSDDYLKDKFIDCTRSILTETNCSALMENIYGLDELGDIHRLIEPAAAVDE